MNIKYFKIFLMDSVDNLVIAVDNFVIRKKKISLKMKVQPDLSISPNNIIIRKKIALKTKSTINQLNDYLDQKFKHHLMFIKDSWADVKYKIRLDNNNQECWWDLELLLSHFAEQLNCSCMSNPSPQWPSNPFNRCHFSKSQLSTLHKQVVELKIPINFMINELFKFLETKYKNVPIDDFSIPFIGFVSNTYRFRQVNNKDSQGTYIGYWVKKSEPLSLFEQHYKELKQISPCDYDTRTNRTFERREYLFYKDILDSMPEEHIDLSLSCITLTV